MNRPVNFVNIVGQGGPEIYSNALIRHFSSNFINIINAKVPQRYISGHFKVIKYFLNTGSFIKNVKKYYKKGLLHLPSQELGRYVKFLNYENLLITVLDIIPPELCQPISKMSNYMHRLDLKGIEAAGHVIAVSEYTKKDLICKAGMSDEKISVIYCGVDHNIFYPRKENSKIINNFRLNKPYILYVGSEQPRKNMNVLIDVFYKVKSECKNINLVILGKGGIYRKNILKQIQRFDLSGDVIFLDYLPQGMLPELYSFSKAFVFPSLYEGFGFPVLEAMCCGTPVVASNASSIPEVVGDAGILLNPLDVKGFADAIINILNNEKERQEFIRKGLIQAKKFSWEKASQETFEIYKKFI